MTDINTQLGQIATESFYDDDTLDEATDTLDTKGDPRAPMKGAAPAQKEGKISNVTPGGETEDMGPAVVSPDAPSDPGVAAEKKAKKATPPGRAGGKGLPSEASAKTVAPTSMDGEVGDKMKGEDVDLDDEDVIIEASGGDDDEEEAEEITIDERVAAIDLSDDVKALTGGEGLSEEFKQKAATIFEAALKAKIRTELERLEEEYAELHEHSIAEAKEEMSEKVDNYLTYVVEEWMTKNEVAIEHKIKTEITESFITGLRNLFIENNIAIPEESFDMLDAAAEQVGELETTLNEKIAENVELTQRVRQLEGNEILLDVASDLADTEVEKFAELAETVEFEGAEDYRIKLNTLKDSYFPKAQVIEEEAAPTDDAYVEVASDTMAAYVSTIKKIN